AREDADPISLPNIMSGRIEIQTPTLFYGGDANVRFVAWTEQQSSRLVVLAGFRMLVLNESIKVQQSSQDLPGFGVQGNNYFFFEEFSTNNFFYGGQVGGEYEWRLGPVFLQGLGKVALGEVQETVKNTGGTKITGPDGAVALSTNSALFVQPGNAGQFTKW